MKRSDHEAIIQRLRDEHAARLIGLERAYRATQDEPPMAPLASLSMVGAGGYAFRQDDSRTAYLRLGAQRFTLRAVRRNTARGRAVVLVVEVES
ncbi:MAG: hypothetical protein JWM95_1739 [Gemmatimonadetes bacterium]|nr:hypothetical protein [Gemmatimonadota bacterium]